jgi:hypothetical protein
MAEKQAMIDPFEPSQVRYRGEMRVVLSGQDRRIPPDSASGTSLTRTGALAV